jgi:hypothetical protein
MWHNEWIFPVYWEFTVDVISVPLPEENGNAGLLMLFTTAFLYKCEQRLRFISGDKVKSVGK